MGFLDTLLGRSKPVKANLDALFTLSTAQITLEASEQLLPTGQAGVCFKPAAGGSFGEAEREFTELLSLDDTPGDAPADAPPADAPPAGGTPAPVRAALAGSSDEYGYRWIVLESADFDTLVTRTHYINSTLDEHGWSTQLLCSVFGFGAAGAQASRAGESGLPGAGATASGGASMYVVYLYKRGTFYPFVPLGGERRDNEAELRFKAELGSDLPIEPDLDRWFPIWKLPLR